MLILRGEIGKKQGRLEASQNQQAQQDLNLILKKWKFGGQPFKDTQDFLDKMGGWIDKQIDQQKELEEFFQNYGITSLKEIESIKVKPTE